jgi:DNA replication protein DnaC
MTTPEPSLIGAEFPSLGIRIDQPAPPPLEWLVGLSATEHYRERLRLLDRAAAEGLYLNGMPPDASFREGWFAMEREAAQVYLERALIRDTIAATRPQGCWCLGLGRQRKPMVASPRDSREGLVGDWYRFCACPEGQASMRDAHERRNRTLNDMENEEYQRRWSGAGVPAHYDWVEFDKLQVEPVDEAARIKMENWLSNSQNNGLGLFIHGDAGAGKTTFAVALLKAKLRAGYSGLFVSSSMLVDRLRSTYSEDASDTSVYEVISKLAQVDVMVIDDLGYEKPTPFVVDKLTSLIDERLKYGRPTIYTSNFTLNALRPIILIRATQRIYEATQGIEMKGKNHRFRATREDNR